MIDFSEALDPCIEYGVYWRVNHGAVKCPLTMVVRCMTEHTSICNGVPGVFLPYSQDFRHSVPWRGSVMQKELECAC